MITDYDYLISVRVSNHLNLDQDLRSVSPDLGSGYLSAQARSRMIKK